MTLKPVFRRSDAAHARARELAALRLDEPLAPFDADWLDTHLGACEACRAVAAGYDEGRSLLHGLRENAPVPPRDLWARTAAAIDTRGRARRRRLGRPSFGRLTVAPIAAVLAVAMVFGAGLLNGIGLPFGKTPGSPQPTAIAMTSGEVRVLTRGADGSLSISTKRYDQVCPIGVDWCSGTTSIDGSTLDLQLAGLGSVDAYLSPSQDHIVVMQKGSNPSGVFVVPVRQAPTPTPTPTPTAGASGSPSATPSHGTASPSPSVEPSHSPAVVTPAPSRSPVLPSEPVASPSGPVPLPSVQVTPGPDGTIQIARDVIVVGSVSAYSADGTRFAFTARPADGSSGPDVYVWDTSKSLAAPVTTDHVSLFAAWVGNSLLVSRAADGIATTTLLDPSAGVAKPLEAGSAWRPALGPGATTAVWWDGTLAPSRDGFTWVPGDGRLVLGAWPGAAAALQATPAPSVAPDPSAQDASPSDTATPTATPIADPDGPSRSAIPSRAPTGAFDLQELAQGPIRDWQVRWDGTGTVLALWVATGAAGTPGQLSLFALDPVTGAADLATPLLAGAPAYEGFSLLDGQLTWSAPNAGGDPVIDVLAWSGDTIGRLQLSVGRGTTLLR